MKAWRVSALGEPRERDAPGRASPTPQPGAGQLLVRVLARAGQLPRRAASAAACTRSSRRCRSPRASSCAARSSPSGRASTGFAVGDRVMGVAVLPHGGFARARADGRGHDVPGAGRVSTTRRRPSLYIGYQTGWFGLHRRARLQPGETLLVHAAAGGVGSAAVQLGKAAGARVIGVVGGPDKAEVARTARRRRRRGPAYRGLRRGGQGSAPAAGAPTWCTTRSAATPTSARPSASRSRAGSWWSASPAGRSSRPRSTTRWSRTTRSSACTGASTPRRPLRRLRDCHDELSRLAADGVRQAPGERAARPRRGRGRVAAARRRDHGGQGGLCPLTPARSAATDVRRAGP